jgi:hypothetical protein
MNMPITSRRYQIHLLKNENKARDEHYQEKIDEVRAKSTGTRKRRISGDELKAKIKRGEVT